MSLSMHTTDSYDRDDRVATAYHEAAHAIFYCLAGEREAIDYATLAEGGRVQLVPFPPTLWPFCIPSLKKSKNTDLRRDVKLFVVNCFSGCAAESSLDSDNPYLSWYHDMLDGTCKFDERPFGVRDTLAIVREDFERAFEVAVLFIGRYRWKVFDYLAECAAIADALVEDSAVWQCIEETAKTLIRDGSIKGSKFYQRFDHRISDVIDGIDDSFPVSHNHTLKWLESRKASGNSIS